MVDIVTTATTMESSAVVTNQEMSTQQQSHSGVKKKQSLLSEVLVNGLMKNINEKVGAKLDDEAQSELAGIVSQKVKEGGIMVPTMERGVSFEDSPFKDHIQGRLYERHPIE